MPKAGSATRKLIIARARPLISISEPRKTNSGTASRIRCDMPSCNLPTALLQQTKILHVSGISQAISRSATETVAQAMRVAREAGALIAYDPNLRLKLWPLERAREVIVAMIPQCDHLPSLDDVQLISGLTAHEDIVAWSHRVGARTVVLKLGRQGSLVSDGQRCVAVAAHPVDAVDATGAGDCFDGSYLAQLASGADPVSAARWASAAARWQPWGTVRSIHCRRRRRFGR